MQNRTAFSRQQHVSSIPIRTNMKSNSETQHRIRHTEKPEFGRPLIHSRKYPTDRRFRVRFGNNERHCSLTHSSALFTSRAEFFCCPFPRLLRVTCNTLQTAFCIASCQACCILRAVNCSADIVAQLDLACSVLCTAVAWHIAECHCFFL